MHTEDLIKLAKAYADYRRLSVATVSTRAARAGSFITGLEQGASCTIRKAHHVARWFSENWPDDLPWPDGVPRPHFKREEAA